MASILTPQRATDSSLGGHRTHTDPPWMKRRSSGWSSTFMSADTGHVHTASPPTTKKTILPILGWIPHLIPSETTYIWTTSQRSSIQAICEVMCRRERASEHTSANPFCATFKVSLCPESSSEHRRFQSHQRKLCSDEYFGAMGQGKSWARTFMLGLWSTFL